MLVHDMVANLPREWQLLQCRESMPQHASALCTCYTIPSTHHTPSLPPYTLQVKEQQRNWAALYEQVSKAQLSMAPITQQELYWAISCVRSRSFSGPYIGSTLSDRLRLGGLVVLLVLTNQLTGLADLQQSLSAAIAVFVFNLMYELILSRSLKQYAMCPVVDLLNHSGATAAEVAYDYFADKYRVTATQGYKKGQQVGWGLLVGACQGTAAAQGQRRACRA